MAPKVTFPGAGNLAGAGGRSWTIRHAGPGVLSGGAGCRVGFGCRRLAPHSIGGLLCSTLVGGVGASAVDVGEKGQRCRQRMRSTRDTAGVIMFFRVDSGGRACLARWWVMRSNASAGG